MSERTKNRLKKKEKSRKKNLSRYNRYMRIVQKPSTIIIAIQKRTTWFESKHGLIKFFFSSFITAHMFIVLYKINKEIK